MVEQPHEPKIDETFDHSTRSDKPTNTVIAKSQSDSNRPEDTVIAKSADDTNRPNQTTVAQGMVKSAQIAAKENPTEPEPVPTAAAAKKNAKAALAQTAEKSPPPSNTQSFISSGPEIAPFPLFIGPNERVDGVWSADRKQVIWHVPKELVERAGKHSMIQTGRIMKVS